MLAPTQTEAAHSTGATGRLWLCHWNWKRLVPLRAASPGVRLVDSTRVRHMSTPPRERAERMQKLGIDALNLHHSDWEPGLRDALCARGRLVFAWDLQELAALRAAFALGVDAVYSDYVDRMQEALAEAD